ncbi:MAG: hypothetical protein KF752_17865 [Pirellulaceae bacterium]|nr:hypothetical protein [Pirellulaceae bacterium]
MRQIQFTTAHLGHCCRISNPIYALIFGLHMALGAWTICQAQSIQPEADSRYGALTWMQQSAEYRMLTQQAYHWAANQLTQAVRDPHWSADEVQLSQGGFQSKPPAVVLDLDETVLDNSAYNARNILRGEKFTVQSWNAWCQEAKAEAIPGALDFVRTATGLGVSVFYLTNREDAVKSATIQNLIALGFPATEDSVLTSNPEAGRGDDKLTRRANIAQGHRIALLIGDSMSDLCSGMDASATVRNQTAADKVQLYGTRWIILPNPVYGGWQRGLPSGAQALNPKL